MPSLTPDPNQALYDRLRDYERRLQALENRRTSERPHLLAYSPLNDTYSHAVYETVVFSSASLDTHDMLNTSTGVLTVPYTGRYIMRLELPARTSGSAGSVAYFQVYDDLGSTIEWSDYFTLLGNGLMPVTLSFVWTAGHTKRIRVYADDDTISTDKSCSLTVEFIKYE